MERDNIMSFSFNISLIFTAVICSTSVQAQEAEQPKEPDNGFTWSINKPTELMFVQTATAMKFDGKKLTLTGVAPATTFFSDHPDRFVGHLSTSQFVSLWNQNTKQYEADPPNASLSVLGETKPPSVVELKTVAKDGDSLTYEVRVLEGEIPKESGAVTLFIDPIMAGGPHGGPRPGPGPPPHCRTLARL